MRAPSDMPQRVPRVRLRGRWWILVVAIVLIIILASLRTLATIYTDSLWFSSVHLHSVWSTLLAIKVGLYFSFAAIFFVLAWVNLIVCDRLSLSSDDPPVEDELIRRYQQVVRPYAGRVYAAISILIALLAASGTVSQWNNWLLFAHGGSFGVKDPQFNKDIGFFVFKLPFLNFLVSWSLIALLLTAILTAIFHYLNGGIRAERGVPRVNPRVKAHLSVLLAAMAIVKAVGYYLARFQLDLSNNGYVQGAGATDVHSRLPALTLLIFVSIGAAVILLFNIRRRGWTLPAIAVGIWAFVALVVGVIYPALYQVLRVNPDQSGLERPYIADNISATRAAYGLDNVKVHTYQAKESPNSNIPSTNQQTLNNVRLWDPSITLATFQKDQDIRSYYTFSTIGVDRYFINGAETPVIVGVRQINPSDLPSSSWVNTHLQYTHGDAMVLSEANQSSGGNPLFGIHDVPPSYLAGLPHITGNNSQIYFGVDQPGYVVADTDQGELDYQNNAENNVETHYQGSGGVQLTSFLERAAFALRLKDFNLLISNQVTARSRIIFVRDVVAMAQKAAPFLSFDADPYAVLDNGHVDWVIDAYTTTSQYPYSQNADSVEVPAGAGLPQSYNYVRNSVKVVIDAYSGKMTFYAMDPNDPILATYERAFPSMFTPASKMSASLRAHLRYPEDMFAAQSALYGRYHITNPANFYTAGDAWTLSPTAGAGPPSQTLAYTQVTNSEGEISSFNFARSAPQYEVFQVPGQTGQSFNITEAYIPAAQGQSIQNLSAFIVGGNDPKQYEQLNVFVTPPSEGIAGPALAGAQMQSNPTVSSDISLLDQHGSSVLLGNVLMVPLGQTMMYMRPMYVEASGNPYPKLTDVIVSLGSGHVHIGATLDDALSSLFGTTVGAGSTTPSTGGTSPLATGNAAQIKQDLNSAQSAYQAAQSDLQSGNLGQYQSEITTMEQDLQAANALIGTGSTTTTTTPATTSAKKSTKKSTAKKASATSATTTPSGATAASAHAQRPST